MAEKKFMVGLAVVILSVFVSFWAEQYISSNYPEMPPLLAALIPPVIAFIAVWYLFKKKKSGEYF